MEVAVDVARDSAGRWGHSVRPRRAHGRLREAGAAGLVGVDAGPSPCRVRGPAHRRRRRLDQLSHDHGRRDAERRLQGVGYGKDLSAYGLEDYTRVKHVMTYTGT
ncbi:hypothetical protein ACE1SV_63280 [Streptomyces sp. E-15]